jgi:hypothetical protein
MHIYGQRTIIGPSLIGRSYFADLRMTFGQNFFLQDWFRNKLGVGLGLGLGLELVFGIGLVLVNLRFLIRFVTLRPTK